MLLSSHNQEIEKDSGSPHEKLSLNAFVKSVTKNVLQMQIFLLLYISKEMYATEISKKLNKSKATVSRHLNAMEKEGLLEVRTVPQKSGPKRKYYRLVTHPLNEIIPESYSVENLVDFLNPRERIKMYRKFVEVLKSLHILFSKGFDIVKPLIGSMDDSLSSIATADKEFARYFSCFFPNRMIHFESILLSKERIAEANALYDEYWSKIVALRDKSKQLGEEDSIVMANFILPLRDLIERSAYGDDGENS